MNPDEKKIFEELVGRYLQPVEAASTEEYYLESLQEEKDRLLSAFFDHLNAIGPDASGDLGEYQDMVFLLERLLKSDKSIPVFERDTRIHASGEGSLLFPREEEAFFFSEGYAIQGTYYGVTVGEYWDFSGAEDMQMVDEDEEDLDRRLLRPFGLHLLLTDPALLHPDGSSEPYGANFALLPLNHGKLRLHKLMTP